MLWVIVGSLYLWFLGVANGQKSSCPLLGTTPATQSGTNNYVIDYFFGVLVYPYAMGQCTSTSFVSGSYSMYTCHQNGTKWYVMREDYTTSSCTASKGKLGAVWHQGESTFGNIGYFECGGVDSYAEIKVALSACSGLETTFGGLGGCALNSPKLIQYFCNDTTGYVQLYENITYLNPSAATQTPKGYCESSLYCDRWSISKSSCGYIATALDNKLYGQLITCNLGTATTSTTKKSAKVQFVPLFSVIFVLVVSFFSFH